MVLLICLINVLFSLILMENFVVISNARSFLQLMLCNQNLTKFFILTLLSSNCRAWALKLSEHLKNNKIFFSLYFVNSIFTMIFFAISSLLEKDSYLKSLLNLCDDFNWKKISKTVIKLFKSQIFKNVTFPWNQLDALV